jgi:acid phosphatase (class A)
VFSKRLAWVCFGFLAVSHFSWAQSSPRPQREPGYLSQIDLESLMGLIPPAPATNDPRDMVDQDVFLATRKLENSSRWMLARKDADLSTAGLMNAFACAFGPTTPLRQPHLAKLLARVSADSFSLFGALKDSYRRKRPFLIHDGPICVDRAEISKSWDYPSGHSTLGYATGLILAEIDPEDGPAILRRARQFGESRLFCGVHNASAVEAGRVLGASLFALLQGSPDFQTDLAAARLERKARVREQTPACKADEAVLAPSPYADLPRASSAPAR